MSHPIILASGSDIRAKMLRAAGVVFDVEVARVDEDALKASLLHDAAAPRDIADALAEFKCRKISQRRPEAIVIGCDQILEHDEQIVSKPHSEVEAISQLRALSGSTHRLHSAVVLYLGAEPIWRHIGTARMTMHEISEAFIREYVSRNWESIRHSVGGYKIEEEGVRLFSRIDGDHFTIQGLPLLPLLSYLSGRGTLPI